MAWPVPRGSPVERHTHSTGRGFPCCVWSPCACMPSPLPRRNRWVHVAHLPQQTAAFPVSQPGRLPHYTFRGLLSVHSRYGLHARQVTRCDPFHRSTSTTLLPPPSLRLLPAERPVAGRDLHPLKIDALHGIRENGTLLFREPLGEVTGFFL